MQLCKDYCWCVLAGTFNCFLDMLHKLHKWVYRAFGCKIAISFEYLAHGGNVATLIFCIGATLEDVHLN